MKGREGGLTAERYCQNNSGYVEPKTSSASVWKVEK